MGDVVNLNQFCKKRERAVKAQKRAANRARSGVARREAVTQAEAARGDGTLDGKRINHEPEEPEGSSRLDPKGD